jgi:type III secretion protein Y
LTRQNEAPVQLLHSLGYLYGRHGQVKRGLVMLLLAASLSPDDTGVLSTLAHVLILNGSWHRALAVIERLQSLGGHDNSSFLLLKSRALWGIGQRSEAKRCFGEYLAHRREPAEVRA